VAAAANGQEQAVLAVGGDIDDMAVRRARAT